MIRGLVLIAGLSIPLALISCSERDPGSPAGGNAQNDGGELYVEHCAECHEMRHPELHKQPPRLHGVFSRKTLPSGVEATDEQVRKTIVEGTGTMPAFDQRLRPDQVEALVQYLHQLK